MRPIATSTIFICLIVLIISKSLMVRCKSIPLDAREVEKLADYKRPIRTNGQLILSPYSRKRKLGFTQRLLKKMFKTMLQRKSTAAMSNMTDDDETTPIRHRRRRRRRQRRPMKIRPRRSSDLSTEH